MKTIPINIVSTASKRIASISMNYTGGMTCKTTSAALAKAKEHVITLGHTFVRSFFGNGTLTVWVQV